MKLLLVEDDVELAAYLALELGKAGHGVAIAHDGKAALEVATVRAFDAIILDRMLPAIDGIGVLGHLRNEGIATPVLMLTALGDLYDRVEGLDAGADDYLVKPVEIVELTARLNAIARRPPVIRDVSILAMGDIEVSLSEHTVRRGGKIVALTPTEFNILVQLMRGADRVVTRRMLLETVWGYRFDPETNIIDAHIRRLRARLQANGGENVILTVRGVGYMFRAAG